MYQGSKELLSLLQYLGKEDLMGASVRLRTYSWVIILFSKTDWLIDFRDLDSAPGIDCLID